MHMMHALTLITFLLIGTQAWAQEKVNNFIVTENGLQWQKVFTTDLTFQELSEALKSNGLFERMEVGKNNITGDSKIIFANYQGAGFSDLETAGYVSDYYYKAFVVVKFKEGMYRVTLKDIQLSPRAYDSTKRIEINNLDNYALKTWKNVFTEVFKKAPSLILDYTFTKKAEIPKKSEQGEW